MNNNGYDLFCEFMQRYEAGERELNAEEKKADEFLASSGRAYQRVAFDEFLEYMEKYQNEKNSGRHM